MAEIKEIETYLVENKSLVLGTVDEKGDPQLRSIGGYGVDGADIYFSTSKRSDKVAQIEQHPQVVLLFQHEGQQIPNLKNITVYGTAQALEGDAFQKGAEIIRARRPQANIQETESNVYHVQAQKVKILDFTKEQKVEVLSL